MRESVPKGRVVVVRWRRSPAAAAAAGERDPVERGMEEKVEEREEEEDDKKNLDLVDLRSQDMVIDYQFREEGRERERDGVGACGNHLNGSGLYNFKEGKSSCNFALISILRLILCFIF